MIRKGLLGGTFNPIHVGHLISANEVISLFQLEEIILIPCASPPHKGHQELIAASHRMAMASLATASNPKLSLSSLEIERGGKSYSIDTINTLKNDSGQELELYFIVGVDVFSDIANWKEADQLLTNSHFVVTNRPGYDHIKLLDKLTREVSPRYPGLRFHLDSGEYAEGVKRISIEGSEYSIFVVRIPSLDISSTDIRRRVAQGGPIEYLVTAEVNEYIINNKLYFRD
jgi:nicotinate-nucleotide adenylyltransferase